jgi:RNA polymerase sigma factor (sigma-70 family)
MARLAPRRIARPSSDRQSERDSDQRLISLVRERDPGAFEELYRKYQTRLSRFLANVVRQPQIVEEVLDDTLMVVWERARDFKGESKLSTWNFAIAYRKAMKALRRYDAPLEDHEADSRVSAEPSPEEAFGHARLQGVLRAAMANLSSDHRAVVELTYFQDLSYREIAEIMECPVDTVKTRMFYARRQLKRCLDGELPDWI